MTGIEPLLIGFLAKAAEKGALEAGKYGLQKLLSSSTVSKAIQATAKDNPYIPEAEEALKKWCESDDFLSLMQEVRSGQKTVSYDYLADSLVKVGGFHAGLSTTQTRAIVIIKSFEKHLEKEIYKSEDAHFVEAQRAVIRHHETQEGLQGISGQMADLPAQITNAVKESILPSLTAISDLESSPIVKEKIHFAKIDLACSLMREGKAKSARSTLEKLRNEIVSDNPSTDLQFRLAANLGICALQLNEPSIASAELEFALRLKPTHKIALSQAALAAKAEGNVEKALKYARLSRSSDEADASPTANLMQVLFDAGEIDELEKLIADEPWIFEAPECALVLGMIRLEQGRIAEAEQHLASSLKGETKDPYAHLLLAQTLVIEVEQQLINDPPLDWHTPPEIKDRLSIAKEHLEQALRKFIDYETKLGLHDSLTLRSHIRRMLGNTEQAMQDCERVLADDSMHVEALRHKCQLLLMKGQPDEALQCFQKLPANDASAEIFIPVAHIYHQKKQFGKVIDLLAPASKSVPERSQLIISDLLLFSYHQLSKSEKTAELLDRLRSERGNDPDASVVISRQLLREGKTDEAEKCLLDALKQASSDRQHDRVSLALAELYFSVENWKEAALYFEHILDDAADSDFVRKYLLSLYKGGLYRQALALSQRLRSDGEAIPFVSEIEARVLEWIGDLKGALVLYEQLSQIEPQTPAYRVGIVRLKNRLNDREGAAQALSAINYEEVRDNSELLIQVAQFRHYLGLGKDLHYAYRARRVGFNDPEIHLIYLGLFLNRSPETMRELDVTAATVDCAVKLVNEKGQEKIYVIEDEEPDATRGEISSNDLRAALLLGRRSGDEVVFNQGQFDETQYQVVEVKSKYVNAFQQTILEFQNWFTHRGMRTMDVGEGDFSDFFAMLDRQHRRSEVLGVYKEKFLPLGTLADLLGRNLFETWAGLVSSDNIRFYASTGELVRLAHEAEALKKADAIVLDLSAVLTLKFLDLLDKLPYLYSRLIIPRAMIDEVNQWLTPQTGEGKPTMTVWKDEEGYKRQEITGEMLEGKRRFLEQVRDFINNHTVSVPVNKALDLPKEQLERYQDALGTSPMASLFVAHELKLPLYTDDLGLSRLAGHNEWGVTGCSSQSVLLRMRDRGLFSMVRYYEALKRLILGNYFFISVDADALWWMCQQNQNQATAEMRHILKQTLQGPDCEKVSALRVGAKFIYKVWLEVTENNDKMMLIDFVTDALISGRERAQIKSELKTVIAWRFGHYKMPLPNIFARIDAFDSIEISSGLNQ